MDLCDAFLLLYVSEPGTFLNPCIREPSHLFMETAGISPLVPFPSLAFLIREVNAIPLPGHIADDLKGDSGHLRALSAGESHTSGS